MPSGPDGGAGNARRRRPRHDGHTAQFAVRRTTATIHYRLTEPRTESRQPIAGRDRQRRKVQSPRHHRRHPHAEGHRAGTAARDTAKKSKLLARFAGFGPVALSIFPDPVTGRYKDAGWQALGEELKTLLTPEEYDSAKRTTFNAFYTSPTVIAAMHEAIARLGVPDNATILEPGCGTGNFMSQGKPGNRFIGVELDSISGRIARALHPEHDIRIESFRDTKLPENRIDAVIGNVPFADLKLDYHGQKLSLHDYFFAKSIDALKPGGVLALVTSHFTLDKQNAAIREYLASKADFVGAIRLPSDAFKREGTAVVTDIVFLRKRAPGRAGPPRRSRLAGHRPACDRGRRGSGQPLLPEPSGNGAGQLEPQGHALRRRRLTASLGNGDLAEQLKASDPPPAGIRTAASHRRSQEEPAPAFTPPPPERHIGEGSFFVGDDRIIYQSEGGQGVPVVYGGTTLKADGTLTGKRLAALVGLRDRARRVLQSQNEGWPEAQPRRGTPRTQPGLRPVRRQPTARSTRPPSAKPPTAASSAGCPTS